MDYRKPKNPGKGVKAAYEVIRKYVSPLKEDRPLYKDIEKITSIIRNGEILEAVEKEVGGLE